MGYKDRTKQRDFQKRWNKARREQWIKEHGPCEICGSWDDLRVAYAGEWSVTKNGWKMSPKWFKGEMGKRIVLCAFCEEFEKGLRNNWWWARLSPEAVEDILSKRLSHRKFAALYRVSRTAIRRIQQRSWVIGRSMTSDARSEIGMSGLSAAAPSPSPNGTPMTESGIVSGAECGSLAESPTAAQGDG